MLPADPTSEQMPSPVGADGGKFDYIDAVRGWAILLVITGHVGERFAELPFPIKKLTNFGWFGVQMFFLASAVTLMMSWRRQKAVGWTAIRHFFIRRFLRIAPMYYLGALIYYVVEPPPSGFDALQMMRSFLFVNAWHPQWIPTTPGWMVVPGGWSIGVEFTFYALFPILASILTTIPRAILFALGALILAVVANQFSSVWLAGYSEAATSNFLYFWFPNQIPVFAFGIVLYHILARFDLAIGTRARTYGTMVVVVAACAMVAEHPTISNSMRSFLFIPSIYFASLLFMAFIFVLAKGAPTIFSHWWLRRLGSLSFSIYVLHFLFVRFIPIWSGGLIDIHATGFSAAGMCALLWVSTVAASAGAATLAHVAVERPGISLARWLTAAPKRKRWRMANL